MLDQLREWLVDWADSPAGPVMLAVLTAAEAITFPLPPDPLLIALALRHPESALLLAGLTTAASVAGGVVGHWLGLRFGRPLLRHLPSRHVERVEALFQRHGFWAVVLAGLTPLPYKVFTISAGVFGIGIPRLPFVLASIVGRGARFFTLRGRGAPPEARRPGDLPPKNRTEHRVRESVQVREKGRGIGLLVFFWGEAASSASSTSASMR